MLVSFNWLKQYVPLEMSRAELEERLSLTGLNHESTEQVGDDLAIDLEVTSNRPDCLGHIGVAREISVIWDQPLTIPNPQPKTSQQQIADETSVAIECPELCPRYTARIIRGVQVGPSPAWLASRLKTLGIAVINNIVDISNYVLMECGQPLHTFDFAKLAGGKIIVRRARPGEQFTAIDHKTYQLDGNMCVIADAQRAVALGGVMGGADTEVAQQTADILIEAAEFDPLSIRGTSRHLRLFSDSSHRFERGVDSEGVDWASRRCCELILDLAGGELAAGVLDVGEKRPLHPPITLRLSQLERILGIQIPRDAVQRILVSLGNEKVAGDDVSIQVQPPSWRRDLEREIDLVEEVARIWGYEKIPEDVGVRMASSHQRDEERRDEVVRHVMTASGYDEAMTASIVSQDWSAAFSPWSDAEPIVTRTPLMRGADCLRKSLVPSLLGVRQVNQALGNPIVELFEIAKVYLPNPQGLPNEWLMLAATSGGDFHHVKGVVETLAASLNPNLRLNAASAALPLLDPRASCRLLLGDEVCGVIGQVTPPGLKQFGLRTGTTVAEIRLDLLGRQADFVRQYQPLSNYPSIEQDLNFIVAEKVRWAELAAAVRAAGGMLLEEVEYRETYRDPAIDGPDKKRLLLSVRLRSDKETLTSDQAEQVRTDIIAACQDKFDATLVG